MVIYNKNKFLYAKFYINDSKCVSKVKINSLNYNIGIYATGK